MRGFCTKPGRLAAWLAPGKENEKPVLAVVTVFAAEAEEDAVVLVKVRAFCCAGCWATVL